MNWLDKRGLELFKEAFPYKPRLALVFNQQTKLSKIIREGLSILYSPAQPRDITRIEMALGGINAKLSQFKEDLPSDMRLREWSSLSELLLPHLAIL